MTMPIAGSGPLRAVLLATAVAATLAAAPSASAHTGDAKCTGTLTERGNSYEGECTLPFQGFPIGMAGVYYADPQNLHEQPKPAEVHVEIFIKVGAAPARPLGVECATYDGADSARCSREYNPAGESASLPEPLPEQGVQIICKGHSHAKYSRREPPAGAFGCWSGDEAREHLREDGFFAEHGLESGTPPDEEPESGPLGPLAGSPLTGTVTTVPYNTYAPDTLVVSRSLGLRYVNADIADHDVVAFADARPAGSAEWCADFDAVGDPCPLFWTPLIQTGEEVPVLGLEDTSAGESYVFYCSIHPYMKGTIEVVE